MGQHQENENDPHRKGTPWKPDEQGKSGNADKSGNAGNTGSAGNTDKSGKSEKPDKSDTHRNKDDLSIQPNMFGSRVFIDPFTDAGFKYTFGRPESKRVLIHLLNTLLNRLGIQIRDIHYQNSEQLAEIAIGRHSIFDIYCITDEGDHIIIEMQSTYQPYYVERGLYYVTFPLQRIGKKGNWDFQMSRVLMVSILNDYMKPRLMISDDVISVGTLYLEKPNKENNFKLLTDRLAFVFVQTYNSSKTLEELKTDEDLWVYLLKNMGNLTEVPIIYRRAPFLEFFEQARVANMNWEEYETYVAKNVDRWERNAIFKGGFELGEQKGIDKGKRSFQKKFILRLDSMGYEPEEIVKLSDVSLEDVQKILNGEDLNSDQ